MPALTLNPETLVVESFTIETPDTVAKPRTFEPGCTLPELCGTTLAD